MVALSSVGKMPGKSWSLQAGETCPGSIDPISKQVLPVCDGCYAKAGNYVYSNVKAPREHNREDWKRAGWVADMVALLDNERYFRWFDSGDVYHPALAFKIYLVMQQTPWCNHWLPTKSYNIPRIRAILERMKELPNVSVRYSSPNVDGTLDDIHGSTVIPSATYPTTATKICDSYERGGKCGPCRACWSKEVKSVAYVAHGVKIKKYQKKLLQAA
jgi:hypothetical protein